VEPGKKHLHEKAEISSNEDAALFDPTKLVCEVKSSSHTNISDEVSDGCIYRVEIGDVVSCACITPTLCSTLIFQFLSHYEINLINTYKSI
jgi:hypothetical protein